MYTVPAIKKNKWKLLPPFYPVSEVILINSPMGIFPFFPWSYVDVNVRTHIYKHVFILPNKIMIYVCFDF